MKETLKRTLRSISDENSFLDDWMRVYRDDGSTSTAGTSVPSSSSILLAPQALAPHCPGLPGTSKQTASTIESTSVIETSDVQSTSKVTKDKKRPSESADLLNCG